MGKTKENSNQNNFNGQTTLNGLMQNAGRDIINLVPNVFYQEAKYTPEPIWRSPFTLAILSWISVIIGILGVFPIGKIIINFINVFSGSFPVLSDFRTLLYLMIFCLLVLLFSLFFGLRSITKRQIRRPLFSNYAISGYGGRITIEKIHIGKCPICGGKMRYYNKPAEFREVVRSDGSIKEEITKRVPALECKRNSKHWCEVDPAEDKVK